MRILYVPAIALALSLSATAFAQSQQTGQTSTRSYKEVEDSLKQAGIQNVRTLDAAYLVTATTKAGDQVTLVIDPPSASMGAGSGQAGSAGQASIRNQQQVRDDLTKAGFTNVQILDAAYLASGKTKNGDDITMMIDPTSMAGSSGGSRMSPGQSGSPSQPSGGPQ